VASPRVSYGETPHRPEMLVPPNPNQTRAGLPVTPRHLGSRARWPVWRRADQGVAHCCFIGCHAGELDERVFEELLRRPDDHCRGGPAVHVRTRRSGHLRPPTPADPDRAYPCRASCRSSSDPREPQTSLCRLGGARRTLGHPGRSPQAGGGGDGGGAGAKAARHGACSSACGPSAGRTRAGAGT
jgi:hypothetical protein